MKLEDQLKNTFESFEPEVDPSVWAKVSSRLPSASSVSQEGGSSGIAKTFISNLSPFAGWIAAAALIAGLGLIYKMNSKGAKATSSVIQSSEKVTTAEKPVEEKSPSLTPGKTTVPSTSYKEYKSGKLINSVSEKTSEPKTLLQNNRSENKSSISDAQSVASANTEKNIRSTVSSTAVINSAQDKPVPHTAVEENKGSASQNNSSVNLENTVAPVLILNSRGGFAPLTVIALTNQNGIKADFNFSDGGIYNNVSSASHQFTEPGIYTVTCLVSGRMLETTVEVLGQLPSVFSPNGDGINDLFVIGGTDVKVIDVHIYDRSGRQMLSAKGKQVSWDGTISGGQSAETGTYFYDIFATSVSGITYKQKGIINLFR